MLDRHRLLSIDLGVIASVNINPNPETHISSGMNANMSTNSNIH